MVRDEVLGDQIEKNKMGGGGGACSTYGGKERCIQGCGGETSEEETTWKTRDSF